MSKAASRRDAVIRACLRVILIGGLALSLSAIILIPRGGVQRPSSPVLLLTLGIGLAICCITLAWIFARDLRTPALQRVLHRLGPRLAILVGCLLQITVAFVFHPTQSSDSAVYLGLAHKLAQGMPYQDAQGFLAFWPPGLPLFLVPFVIALRDDFYVLLVSNLILYFLTALSVYYLARNLFNSGVALLAVWLLAIWPSRIFLSTIASKENLTIAVVTMGLAIAVSLSPARTRLFNNGFAAVLGLLLGLAALAQPGLSLLFCAFPFGLWHFWKKFGFVKVVGLLATVTIGFGITITPWVVRNYSVFNKEFVGIATNGGSVFYRSNNDLSGAEYTARGTVDLTPLPELEQNATGFRLGKQWITENPVKELRLAARKFAALLDNDSQGVYWALQRGSPNQEPGRWPVADIYNLGSYWYWMMLCAAVAISCARTMREYQAEAPRIALLLLPFIYCAVVFSIFESGARQHMFAVPALIVVAASAAEGPTRARKGSGSNST